jgi:SPOR domain
VVTILPPSPPSPPSAFSAVLVYLSLVPPIRSSLAAALLLTACGGEPEHLSLDRLPASTRAPAPSSLLRLPDGGGPASLYRVPSLAPSSWKAEDVLPPVQRVVGADAELGLVYSLDRKRNLVTLDLETRRVRTSLEQVRAAAMGPDGALYAVDTASAVTQLVRRAPVRFRSKLQGTPRELYATMTGALLARVGEKAPVLEVLGPDQAPVSMTLPTEQFAPSFYGDLVAVATDTGVIIFQTQGKNAPKSMRLSGHPQAVVFSPSGHRLYVAQEDDELEVLDRWSGERLESVDLPGPSKGLRNDRFGQWLLVRPADGDSVWVIDVGRWRLAGSVATKWAADLPAVASPNTLVLRQGKDVVALDLSAKGFPETGRIQGGAGDEWLAIPWRPARDAEIEVAPESTALAGADSGKAAAAVYLQVSSSQNPAWANELADKLRAAGLPASVLAPTRSDEAHRVVLGPYATREQAESTGRKLGMPSFVVSGQDTPDR